MVKEDLNTKAILNDMAELEELIIPLKKFLKKHPDDLAVQCNLDSLQARYDEHLIELTFKKNNDTILNVLKFYKIDNDNEEITIILYLLNNHSCIDGLYLIKLAVDQEFEDAQLFLRIDKDHHNDLKIIILSKNEDGGDAARKLENVYDYLLENNDIASEKIYMTVAFDEVDLKWL